MPLKVVEVAIMSLSLDASEFCIWAMATVQLQRASTLDFWYDNLHAKK